MRLVDADAYAFPGDLINEPTIEAYTEQEVREAFNAGYSQGKEGTVKRGRWVHNDEYVLWAEKYVCSICGRNALSDGDYRHELSNYCPNCGARMDLED